MDANPDNRERRRTSLKKGAPRGTTGGEVINAGGSEHYEHTYDSKFDHPTASAFANYSGPLNPRLFPEQKGGVCRLFKIPRGSLWPDEADDRVTPLAQVAHDELRAHILGEFYPCLGARSVFRHGTYRFGFYKHLARESSVLAMGRDLRRFVSEFPQMGEYCAFVSAFKYPQSTTEPHFEKLLWRHLQMLHDYDQSGWDPHYSADPESGDFAFSFAGCAFFVIGMHSGASRQSRRLAFPVLVFNPEAQIRRLIEAGELENFAEAVRKRDIDYQGDINPSLPPVAGTTGGEAHVYSGARHDGSGKWECPFHPRADLPGKT